MSNDNKVAIPKWLIGIPVSFIFLGIAVINKGFAVSLTWNLIMPMNFGLPNLSIPQAIALTALVTLTVPTYMEVREDARKLKIGLFLFTLLIRPWLLFLIALVAFHI